ncbi:MAG: histidine triad nucleotide-binding protein [Gemmatimonadota bacterium]
MPEGDCIFCKIAAGELSADVVHGDEHTVAFRDINPQAPVHVLVIPRRHIASVDDVEAAEDVDVMGRLFVAAKEVAEREGVAASGYRLVVNTGEDASQTVDHIHMHLIGGRGMTWPPG